MSDLTPWFPNEIKPVRVGVYNASVDRDPDVWRHWNGHKWSYYWPTGASEAFIAESRSKRTDSPLIEWRGLANPPKGKK